MADIVVKLNFKNQKSGIIEHHQLEQGSNIIGRNKPNFITDSRISRKHAEIIVSEIGLVTFNQIGETNNSILLRPETEAIKMQKGKFQTLQNNDSICLYDGAQPFTISIEKFEPMQIASQLDDHETIATQQVHPDDSHLNPLNYLKETVPAVLAASNVGSSPSQTNNNNNVDIINTNNKRNRDDLDESSNQRDDKKLKNSQQIQQQSNDRRQPANGVVVEDSLRINIVEEELTYVKVLGSGACGKVSLFEWKGTPVAVKVIYKSLLHKDKKGEFEKETQILKCLRHPNVVLFMGTCNLQGDLSIVTEYLNRGSVRDVLNSPKPIDWNTKIKMSIDIAQGMNYLHNYNPRIIHRDLKCVNLLVDNNFNVKVSDFGLSRFISGSGQESAKTFCGTLPFIAPEVFAGRGYSTQADVFSFGIVLWEILTHKQPSGNTASTVLGHPEIPSNCPVPFSDLIKACCHKNPDLRPNFSQIIQRLKAMISVEDGEYTPTSNPLNGANNTVLGSAISPSTPSQILTPQKGAIRLQDYTIQGPEISKVTSIRQCENFELLRGQYKDKPVSIRRLATKVNDFEKKQLEVMANLSKSPLIQDFYGVVFNDQEHALICEYCENESLYQLMNNPSTTYKFTWNHTIDLAIQMASAINLLHKQQPPILHRGITSSSFLLTSEYHIKVTDFGLSRFAIHENSASLGEIKGDFFYSPPELLSSKKFTQKSDVYSYAIVLWELLQMTHTQQYKKPFYHIDLEYDFQIVHQTSKFNKRPKTDDSHIPKEFQKLLQQSWDQEPMLRPDFDKIIEELNVLKSTFKPNSK
ncbi:SMAD/FHA domain-containing protein [Tieghemostelium lacteum]|uniref:SMAD/FHA domain-containing protein n=1 Tax=Tieghemostelium lacteum TaxID=361077 RepID=A0A152A9D0_TIELA|nr:SMAD/FHA domain-containing protein [Tieghemostelium lacteum]|eukprot:KYR02832.1 SMAD/FHA domain-containing protein [Tieghemostelium lacteum]